MNEEKERVSQRTTLFATFLEFLEKFQFGDLDRNNKCMLENLN